MKRIYAALAASVFGVFLAGTGSSQTPEQLTKPKASPPRLVPVAETKLIMQGINQANFQGLEKLLKTKDLDSEGWAFARGQALLIAESGNLLMMRPPRNSGQDAWLKAGMELRDRARDLARTVSTRDVNRSRAGLTQLANTCNKCHQTFSVKTRVSAFSNPAP